MRSLRKARRPLVALVALVVALVVGYAVHGGSSDGSGAGSSASATSAARSSAGAVALSSLPAQAGQTVRLIRAGGPFPYPRNDGVVFHNDEHHLPGEPDGYYREYTVPTPGADTRGARRIVLGRNGTYWYTGDHYESFHRVDVAR